MQDIKEFNTTSIIIPQNLLICLYYYYFFVIKLSGLEDQFGCVMVNDPNAHNDIANRCFVPTEQNSRIYSDLVTLSYKICAVISLKIMILELEHTAKELV